MNARPLLLAAAAAALTLAACSSGSSSVSASGSSANTPPPTVVATGAAPSDDDTPTVTAPADDGDVKITKCAADETGMVAVEGFVKNTTGHRVQNLNITFEIVDPSGTRLDTVFGSVELLAAGQRARFYTNSTAPITGKFNVPPLAGGRRMSDGPAVDERMILFGNLIGEILGSFRLWINDKQGLVYLEHRPCHTRLPSTFERNLDEIVGEALEHHNECRARAAP